MGLVGPASASFLSDEVAIATEVLAALGLKARVGPHAYDRHGYLAGQDRDRAADINAFFADPEIKGILAIRGGWGCARVLPYLDYPTIRSHPKVLVGYSDVTALHTAIQARTGLVTFHGPTALDEWSPFAVEAFRRVVFEGQAAVLANPAPDASEALVPRGERIRAITPGRARGRLLGGNLTVLTAILGSPYVPDFEGAILFVEDIREYLYRVDRMLTQLSLAGILGRIRGFVFGRCTTCDPDPDSYGSLTLEEILEDHVKPLGIPAFEGAAIGHVPRQYTVPIGIEAELDAERGTLTLLEPAVARGPGNL